MITLEKAIIVSNNPLVWNRYPKTLKILGSFRDVLISVRNDIHKGSSLITHSLAGSVKPNETPYKSLIILKKEGKLDFQSLTSIEKGIETVDKFLLLDRDWSEQVLRDFQIIDADLLESALKALAPNIILDR